MPGRTVRGRSSTAAANPWPIKRICSEETFQELSVPLPEDELLASMLCRKMALFIKKDYYEHIINELEGVEKAEINLGLTINSANHEVGETICRR